MRKAGQHHPLGWHASFDFALDQNVHVGHSLPQAGLVFAARRLERVLWNDPASGVMRHADAGYEIAVECAKEQGLKLPGITV